MTNQLSIAKVNNVSIIIIEDGEKRVAVKPICEALGIDPESQRKKISGDEILGSTTVLSTAVGADGKERQMTTIPFKYVFGWLFSINPKNVAPEAKEIVIRYKMECYDALYNYFTGYADFVVQRQAAIDSQLDTTKLARKNYRSANSVMKDAEKELDRLRYITYEKYKADNSQSTCFTKEEQKG